MKDLSLRILALFTKEEIKNVNIGYGYSAWNTICVIADGKTYRIEINEEEEEGK